jgi:hypothetical protein
LGGEGVKGSDSLIALSKEEQSSSAAADHGDKESGHPCAMQFSDNRPEAIDQKNLKAMVNNSQQVRQQKSYADMFSSSPPLQMNWESDGKPAVNKAGTSLELQEAITKLENGDNSVPPWVNSRAKRAIRYAAQIMNWKGKYFNNIGPFWDNKPDPARKSFVRKMLVAKRSLPKTFNDDWLVKDKKSAWKQEWMKYQIENIATEKSWLKFKKGLDHSLKKEVTDREAEYKWGDWFQNSDGNLPGVAGAGGYLEYYAEPNLLHHTAGGFWGANRILAGVVSGKVWVTENHYQNFTRVSDASV